MSNNYPTVIPMLSYEDGVAALEWLAKAFGFRERTRMLDEQGRLSHGEMAAGEGVIMLATPTPDYESPAHHRQSCEQARKWSAVPWVTAGSLWSAAQGEPGFLFIRSPGLRGLLRLGHSKP